MHEKGEDEAKKKDESDEKSTESVHDDIIGTTDDSSSNQVGYLLLPLSCNLFHPITITITCTFFAHVFVSFLW